MAFATLDSNVNQGGINNAKLVSMLNTYKASLPLIQRVGGPTYNESKIVQNHIDDSLRVASDLLADGEINSSEYTNFIAAYGGNPEAKTQETRVIVSEANQAQAEA